MNFFLFGLFLIEFCSAQRCRREKGRIKELSHQKRELQIERNELKEEIEELKRKLEDALEVIEEIEFEGKTTTTTPEISTTTMIPIEPSDVSILVIPYMADKSYLQSGDGSSQIFATINAPENDYAEDAVHALVNGKLHLFGGYSDSHKIARLDGCTLNELPARLNEQRYYGHAAVTIENGQKALVCFGHSDDYASVKSCEIFDGSATALNFAAEWTHDYGDLGLYKHQPATIGCSSAQHRKAETLSSTGWTALPDHPLKIAQHSLVGLDNGALLLLGGVDSGSDSFIREVPIVLDTATILQTDWGSGNYQTGIWQLKEEKWSRIGELSQRAKSGSAIYISRSVYYFGEKSAIDRVDLDENENLEAVEEIGSQPAPGDYWIPILYQTDNDYCT